ncbi:hypothetical protein PhaeoP128_00323 [Phaeobacter gallaeciensis]|nr:hypothetical protein PhaeoP129_00323 [Phaeobacter gallaeciensis]ATF21100.1 hypothetical protein PhaeoP128_00323 [Phaeobacter gallaeciensis]
MHPIFPKVDDNTRKDFHLSVAKRFEQFHNNILLTQTQLDNGSDRRKSVIKALNAHYWNSTSETEHSKFVGSRGKFTSIGPPRDVDVLFWLPPSVYDRFQARTGNIQSQLLQEVKTVLQKKFYSTAVKGDGPVVKIPFTTFNVELIPAFKLDTGNYWVCFTNDGGSYKTAAYDAEKDAISQSNDSCGGKTRELVRMMKKWQEHCSVPIKSFWIELVAIEFLQTWEHRDKGKVYYDYMVRDFLLFLKNKRFGNVYAPGTYESMYLGDAWYSRADTAHQRAIKACSYETSDVGAAGDEWRKIFGNNMPRIP